MTCSVSFPVPSRSNKALFFSPYVDSGICSAGFEKQLGHGTVLVLEKQRDGNDQIAREDAQFCNGFGVGDDQHLGLLGKPKYVLPGSSCRSQQSNHRPLSACERTVSSIRPDIQLQPIIANLGLSPPSPPEARAPLVSLSSPLLPHYAHLPCAPPTRPAARAPTAAVRIRAGSAAASRDSKAMQDRMRRQGQYGEADINSMVAAQLHHYQAQQRIPQHPDNSYPGRDSAQASGEHQYAAPKVRQSQWDRGGPNTPSQAPSYSYNEGQGAASAQSFYDGKRSDLKVGIEKQPSSKESRDQSRIDRTETRYEDYNLPRTFEGLEQSFHEEILMLSKELHDAEDAENSRHRERLEEINAQHQEKLLALRARQATYREEFLRKESVARQQQYQQASMSHYANNPVPGDQHGYHPAAVVTAVAAGDTYGEAHRGYASAQYESFGDRPDYPEFRGGGRGRGRGNEQRSQYPGGRAYNSGGRRF